MEDYLSVALDTGDLKMTSEEREKLERELRDIAERLGATDDRESHYVASTICVMLAALVLGCSGALSFYLEPFDEKLESIMIFSDPERN